MVEVRAALAKPEEQVDARNRTPMVGPDLIAKHSIETERSLAGQRGREISGVSDVGIANVWIQEKKALGKPAAHGWLTVRSPEKRNTKLERSISHDWGRQQVRTIGSAEGWDKTGPLSSGTLTFMPSSVVFAGWSSRCVLDSPLIALSRHIFERNDRTAGASGASGASSTNPPTS